MSDKSYTILLTSNSSTEVKSVTISKGWVNAVLFAVVIIAVIALCIFFDYIKILSTHNQTNALLSENIILKQKFSLVESKLLKVEKKLQRVHKINDKIEKLNLSFLQNKTQPTSINVTTQKEEAQPSATLVPAIGPLQASLTPIESFFNKLSLFKKAPLSHSTVNKKTQVRAKKVETKILNIFDRAKKEELLALDSWEGLSHKKNIYDSTPNLMPVPNGWYTSKFGLRSDPFTGISTMHSGLDIAAAPGSPVYSPASGVVSYVSFESGYGNLVTIDHGYGLKTRYAHNSEIFVKYGQRVRRGDVIAAVGNTGRSSGYHLHYEVRINGVAVDPKKYIVE